MFLIYCRNFIRTFFKLRFLNSIFIQIVQAVLPKKRIAFNCCVLLQRITKDNIVFSEHSLRCLPQAPNTLPSIHDFFPNHALSQYAFDKIKETSNIHPLTRHPLSTCYVYTPDNKLACVRNVSDQKLTAKCTQADALLLSYIRRRLPDIAQLIQDRQAADHEQNRLIR